MVQLSSVINKLDLAAIDLVIDLMEQKYKIIYKTKFPILIEPIPSWKGAGMG